MELLLLYVAAGLALSAWFYFEAPSITEDELFEMNELGFFDVEAYRAAMADVHRILDQIEQLEATGYGQH